MTTQAQAVSVPSSPYGSRKSNWTRTAISYNTRIISTTNFHAIDHERCHNDTSSWLQDQERIQLNHNGTLISEKTPATSPIAVRIRPRRLSGHLFGSYTISPGEVNKFDASTQGQVATAVRISQHKPQAINVTSSYIDIEPATRAQAVNAAGLHQKSTLQHHDSEGYDRSDSASSWISQSTFSDYGSFSTFESAISVSTSVSDHEVVKGFTPGGPPSMYRSQSNLSKIGPGIRKNSLPPRTPSRDSHVTVPDMERDDECSIEDNYEDDDSNSDSDCRSNCSGLTMLFASKGPMKCSKTSNRLYPLPPRKARNQMLAAELTKPIQESLLEDRRHKRQVDLSSIRRTQSDILYSDRYFHAGIFQYW